jgi:hypothetical protein
MAIPKLKKHLPDRWYERQRRYVDNHINRVGQIVKQIKRTDRVYNFYNDLLAADVMIRDIKAMIVREPLGDSFMGKILGQLEEEVELSAYFKRDADVETGDLIVIELKSTEGNLDRDVYEVVATRTWLYEQEGMRKWKLSPLRDGNLAKHYGDEGIDTNPPTFEGSKIGSLEMEKANIMGHPGGFSTSFAEDKLYPFPVDKATVVPDTVKVLQEEADIKVSDTKDETELEDIQDRKIDEIKDKPKKKKSQKTVNNPFKGPMY